MGAEEDNPRVYQIRIFIRGISPMIWRRLLVRSDSTIADLHYTLQLAFGWGNFHLHQFLIRGKSYGIAKVGGISFYDNPHKVTLEQFKFRLKERFVYEYNFFARWELEVRVEKELPLNPKKTYPVCIGGALTSPDEECPGPLAYLSRKQQFSEFSVALNIMDIISEESKSKAEMIEDIREELWTLQYWRNPVAYSRRNINKNLKRFALQEEGWDEPFAEVFMS